MSEIQLRKYQEEAIRKFESNKRIGLFEMATGTGKTITSLFAAQNAYKEIGRQCLIIIVPYLHLIPQWAKDFSLINVTNYLEISSNTSNWVLKLENLIWEYNNRFRDRIVIIGSYKSISSQNFQELMLKIKGDRFLIADECHNIGSPSFYGHKFGMIESRLGLSATPRRWWDDKGTELIVQLFKETVYNYSMEQAINQGFLTEYYYHPKIVDLTDEEKLKYGNLTIMIINLMKKKNKSKEDVEELESLQIKRSRIIQKAKNKLSLLLDILKKKENHKYTLVYCGEGEIDEVVNAIAKLNIRVSRFNSELNIKKRKIVLENFANGAIEVLVAIRCLDEGVDIPATQTAYFLSSTSNPRQFVQRRGRILRQYENKKYSTIYDFVVLPNTELYLIFKSIAEKEVPRFAEFSSLAINKYQSREQVRKKLSKYNLEEYLDILPWEMYKRKMEEYE